MAGAGGVRVHFVLPFFHPVVGGVETRVHQMGKRLAQRGHEVVVHCIARDLEGDALPAAAELDGIRIRRVKPSLHRGGFLLLFLPKLPEAVVADVNGYPLLTADWLRMVRRRKVTLVRTPHGAPFPAATKGARLTVRAYDALLGVPTLKRARRVVVMTQNETRWMVARGVPAERIAEVPSGVDDDAFRPRDPNLAKERWGLGRYFLFLGRLYREKGPSDLLEAFGALAGQHPDVGVVIAGPDQGEGARIRQRAAQLGLEKRVILTGPVPEEDKWRLLAGCEALVMPSAWEAQGVVFLEAWAQGRPVVAARTGGVPYIVEHGRTGLLVPWAQPAALAEALRGLLANPGRARALGEQGRSTCQERFRWEVLVPRLEAVYQEVEAGG